jgi:PilZ domain
MPEEKRRSQRVKLSIPLRIHGIDGAGKPYQCDARTVDLNRHGARIQISRLLAGGETIRVFNAVNRREADFRVAGPVSPQTKDGGVFGVVGPISEDPAKRQGYGIESLDHNLNFWGITFPRPVQGESSASALLQCRKCQTTAVLNISLVEVDVLETAGIIPWPCDTDGAVTPWGYAEKDPVTQPSPESPTGGPPQNLYFRKHRRVSLQLPLRIRKYSGAVEITKCEDISKGGVCFVSQKHYYTGEGVLVACPYNASGQNIEVEAQIVRQQEIEGTNSKIYGVKFGSPEE